MPFVRTSVLTTCYNKPGKVYVLQAEFPSKHRMIVRLVKESNPERIEQKNVLLRLSRTGSCFSISLGYERRSVCRKHHPSDTVLLCPSTSPLRICCMALPARNPQCAAGASNQPPRKRLMGQQYLASAGEPRADHGLADL